MSRHLSGLGWFLIPPKVSPLPSTAWGPSMCDYVSQFPRRIVLCAQGLTSRPRSAGRSVQPKNAAAHIRTEGRTGPHPESGPHRDQCAQRPKRWPTSRPTSAGPRVKPKRARALSQINGRSNKSKTKQNAYRVSTKTFQGFHHKQ